MQHPSKSHFLERYGFPAEWEAWGLYPDELFQAHQEATSGDTEPHPDEHLRYGAFCWWLRRHRGLTEQQLIQLCRLAALDGDPAMAGAAIHDILFHPNANVEVAMAAAELAQGHQGWRSWFSKVDPCKFFLGMLDEARSFWAERHSAHRLAIDLREQQLTGVDLRALHASGGALVLRGLVEHPRLPEDLLLLLSELRSGRFCKVIRSMAAQRLAGKHLAPTGFAEKYSSDPWLWPR